MAIFVDADTKVVVQGLTGGQGRFHGLRNRDYGTQVVAGVTPGKGGQDVDGIPVFDSVAEAVAATGATASFVAVPPKAAPAAILEAGPAGIGFVVCITEGIPAQDEARVYNHSCVTSRAPGCSDRTVPGIISPGKCNIGITPSDIAQLPTRRRTQRRDRQPIGDADLPGALRAQAERHRRVHVRRHRWRPGAGHELRRLPRRVPEGPGDARHHHVRRDRRLGRGGGGRVHPASVTKPMSAYIAGVTAPAGQQDGPCRRDRLGRQGHGAGEDGRARLGRRATSGSTRPRPAS